MAEIRWTEEAVHWLQEIHKYISKDNVNIANKVVDEIFEKTQILETFPKVGYKYENQDNIRVLLYGHYRIAYLIKDSKNIDILGVFHGSLDIEKYLKI
jgi:plasmid stabilization system protein ParE